MPTKSSLAAQLYTLREFTKTPADIAKTFARVKKIGYEAVQCSALGPIKPKELAAVLDGEGLTCCATHTSMDRMRDQTQEVIDELRLLQCEYTAIGGFFPTKPKHDDWVAFSKQFNLVAAKFEGSGISVGYHNHSHELVRYGHQTALEMLIELLSKQIWFEIDTYWISHGGGDPSAYIDKVSGRIPCVHLKDMAISDERTQHMAEVGEGNLNWPRILERTRAAGARWLIVEQDICQRDPFDSLKISLENLHKMGVK